MPWRELREQQTLIGSIHSDCQERFDTEGSAARNGQRDFVPSSAIRTRMNMARNTGSWRYPRVRCYPVGGYALRNMMDKLRIETAALGILPGEEIVRRLASSDALLFVRGRIPSPRRGAITVIACGLLIAAREGPETASPITGVGVVFADPRCERAIGEALLNVLSDPESRAVLSELSRRAQDKYFSWRAFAGVMLRPCAPGTEFERKLSVNHQTDAASAG